MARYSIENIRDLTPILGHVLIVYEWACDKVGHPLDYYGYHNSENQWFITYVHYEFDTVNMVWTMCVRWLKGDDRSDDFWDAWDDRYTRFYYRYDEVF